MAFLHGLVGRILVRRPPDLPDLLLRPCMTSCIPIRVLLIYDSILQYSFGFGLYTPQPGTSRVQKHQKDSLLLNTHSASVGYNVLLCGPAGLELVVVALFRNRFKLCLSVFYRPPSSPPSIFDTLCNSLLSVHHTYFSNFVILGDFNVNFEVSHRFYTHLSDFMASFSLSQVVQSPTHFSPCGRWSLIDLAFVSNLSCLSTCTVIPSLPTLIT